MKHFTLLMNSIANCPCFFKKIVGKKVALLLFTMLVPGALLVAQNVVITGIVKNTANESIPGASIVEQGTTNGTITDLEGKFRLELKTSAPVIDVSYVGYLNEIIDVAGRTEIEIVLIDDIMMLSEFVVIGYGTARKSDLTGAVSSIKATELEKQPLTQIGQALQGRTPGVLVTSASGAPGASSRIRIRGMNSLYGDNNPLYIVDGIAMSPDGINVNDIESIEVLKDASSTAIYGNRGSNGVVLITTKRGKEGKTLFNFDYTHGFDQIPESRIFPTLNAVEYMKLTNELVLADTYTDEQIAQAELSGESTNWQDEILRMGSTQNYQLSVSGGNDKTTFYVAGSYVDQQGIIMNTDSRRYSLRSNIESKINDKITFLTTNNIGYRHVHNSGAANIHEALVWSPSLSVRDSLGEFNYSDPIGHKDGRNPVASLTDQDSNQETLFINSKAEMSFEILPGLSFRPVVGLDYANNQNKYFNGKGLTGSTGQAGISNGSNLTIQNSNILSYIQSFNNVHDINVALVNEWIVNRNFGYGVSESDIPNNYFGYYNLGTGSVQNLPWSNFSANQLLSFLGRANYTYNNKYMLTASLRTDASSKFKGDNKWGYFPSAALAWKASEEGFIKDLDVFDLLKFRVSYGVTGSQAISPYQTQSIMGSNPRNFGYPYASTTLYRGYGLGGNPNPALRWETTETQNAGLDMSFFRGRLNMSVDVFNKNTTDMLYPKLIPVYQGGGTIMTNIGTNNNKGVEFLIEGRDIIDTGDFRWSTSINGSFIETQITALPIQS
jgi:TonB-dependent starch-binding outer membrane protein SusC